MTYSLAIDIGGTFTDLVVIEEGERTYPGKVLSTPGNPAEGVIAGLDTFVPELSAIDYIVHGTTVGLNAFLERKGTRVLLLMTEGVRDAYSIARHDRKELYTLRYRKPTPLGVPVRFEGWQTRVAGRRIHAAGHLLVDGAVTVEAEGTFVQLSDGRVMRMLDPS